MLTNGVRVAVGLVNQYGVVHRNESRLGVAFATFSLLSERTINSDDDPIFLIFTMNGLDAAIDANMTIFQEQARIARNQCRSNHTQKQATTQLDVVVVPLVVLQLLLCTKNAHSQLLVIGRPYVQMTVALEIDRPGQLGRRSSHLGAEPKAQFAFVRPYQREVSRSSQLG